MRIRGSNVIKNENILRTYLEKRWKKERKEEEEGREEMSKSERRVVLVEKYEATG